MNINFFSKVAHEMADQAGQIALRYFRHPTLQAELKSDHSPVTIADKEIERYIRNTIKSCFPSHGILGEEEGVENATSDYLWIIDPIDGTKNFIMGRPLFGILIALWYQGKPLLGLIDQPYTKERWFAAGDLPTTHNGQKVEVCQARKFSESKLLSSSPDIFDTDEEKRLLSIKKAVSYIRWETECYGYGLLAMGLVDGVIEKFLKPYDYAALVKVVENAGGIITDFQSKPLTLNSDGNVIASANAVIHQQILNALNA